MKLKTNIAWACLACWLIGCGGGSGGAGGGAPVAKVSVPATPDGTVQTVVRSMGEGKPQAVWTALPKSYQSDVKGLITDFAGKMDKEVWDKSFVVLGKVTKLAKDKKDFILNHPFLGMTPLADKAKKDEAIKNWDAVVQLFDIIVKSDIKTVDGLKNLDPEKFLGDTVAKLMAESKRIAAVADKQAEVNKFEKMKEAKVTVVSSDDKTAKVKIEIPGEQEVEELELTKVEDKWLPAKMVAEWSQTIKNGKEQIADIKIEGKDKVKIMDGLTQVDAALDDLLAAKTQDDFNAAVGKTMGTVTGIMQGGPPEKEGEDDKK